jgi:hypothetical protein
MKNPEIAIWVAAATLLMAAPVFSQSLSDQGQVRAIETVLSKQHDQAPPSVSMQDLLLKVNGKKTAITSWTPIQGSAKSLELVLLIDDTARTSLGIQLSDIANFIKNLPPSTKTAIAYMENGRAVFTTPLTTDRAQALQALRLPGGSPGYSSSPYFCLSDLAKNWPSHDNQALRETVMVTDGVDYYERRYDPEDPYVLASISDSLRAGLVVYSIYWINRGRADSTFYENNAGQNLLSEVSEATGGKAYWQGMGNPVTFAPYFDDLITRFKNQYELRFVSPLRGKAEIESLDLKLSLPRIKVDAPRQVNVFPIAHAQQ